ncbi:MAG: GTP diphosphokinase [Beggiatoa sp. IS2]|nr:MAG: GTP diphosphokinase [Beggiatoa sp. IS2]
MVNTKESFLTPTTGNNLNVGVWLERINQSRPPAEQQAIIKACLLASEAYHSRKRPSGETYLTHVLMVADILADLGMDTEVLIAGILHDILEYTSITSDYLRKNFGEVVASLVDGVAKMRFIDALDNTTHNLCDEDSQTESLRKMLLAMVADVRVVIIKLADRLHNMRVLRNLAIDKQKHFAKATLDLFAPLANRLGIWQIKWELEDLSLRCLEPETYQQITKLLDERRISREKYIKQIVEDLSAELKSVGIEAELSGRPKHIYSIWHKMQRKGLDFHQIFDVRAVRVLVNTVTECYMALGIVHNKWQPLRGEFDDYIANPKSNNYQSLHTAVIGPDQKIFEVQIRTAAMHHNAELGVAAHWRYKEEHTKRDESFEQKIAWLRQLSQWREEESNTDDFIDRFKSEIFEDRVYALSPQGKIIDLPQGATPLDFAYYIHTELGHRCRGAKVNGRMVPLTYTLKNGEQVEVLTSKEERPSRDWLSPHLGYLKTSRAQAKVRQWLKKQDAQQHIRDGRMLLDRELRRLNLNEVNFEQLAQRLHFSSVDDFLASLGRGDTSVGQVANCFNEQIFRRREPILPVVADVSRIAEGIYIRGVGGLLTHTAGCCKPVPYDPVVGYITKGRGVIVHRRDCANMLRWQDEGNERLIEVEWSRPDNKVPPDLLYPVDIEIHAYDRTGLLRDVGAIAANEKINIIATNTITDKVDNSVKMVLTLEINNLDQLSQALAKIDNLTNVVEVARKT